MNRKTLKQNLTAVKTPLASTTVSGSEWIVDATGCNAELLANLSIIRLLCEEVVSDLDISVLGSPQWHQFPGPGGVTGLYLLSESHLACHTYPEFQLLTLNLYSCRPQADWPWEAELANRVQAVSVHVRQFDRGQDLSSDFDTLGERE